MRLFVLCRLAGLQRQFDRAGAIAKTIVRRGGQEPCQVIERADARRILGERQFVGVARFGSPAGSHERVGASLVYCRNIEAHGQRRRIQFHRRFGLVLCQPQRGQLQHQLRILGRCLPNQFEVGQRGVELALAGEDFGPNAQRRFQAGPQL